MKTQEAPQTESKKAIFRQIRTHIRTSTTQQQAEQRVRFKFKYWKVEASYHDRQKKREDFARAWADASLDLGIEVRLNAIPPGMSQRVSVFLPNFGRPEGMLIEPTEPPAYSIDDEVVKMARKAGLHWTFVNAEKYRHYDFEVFTDALRDSGYFGNEAKPGWMIA